MPQTARDQTRGPSGAPGMSAPWAADAPGATRRAILDNALGQFLEGGPHGAGEDSILWSKLDPHLSALAEGVAQRMLRANDQERAEVRLLRRLCARHAAGVLLTGGRLELAALPREEATPPTVAVPALERLVVSWAALPGRSDLVRGVAEAVAHPMSNAGRVARAVERDRGLAGLILRLVNSNCFGLGAPMASLERAVTFVGLAEVQALALAVAARRALYKEGAGRDRAWRRALTCGLIARFLARRLHVPAKGLFSAGLLHGLGDGILEDFAPETARAARDLAVRRGKSLAQVQRLLLGYDGARLGGGVLRSWQLADAAADLVAGQHEPGSVRHSAQAMVLHLSVVLAAVLDLSESGLVPAPLLEPAAWKGAVLNIRVLSRVIDQALRDRVFLARVLDV